MSKLTDVQIRNWIKAGDRFEGRGDGGGLYLRFRAADAVPSWLFRYRLMGKQRVMVIGNYTNLSLADARKEAKRLSAQAALGHDVAGQKQERKAEAVAKIEAEARKVTVADLADDYFQRMIAGRWKHPNIVRSRIEKDIKPAIGKMKVESVRPADIDAMLQTVVKRGAPTIANDVLRWVRRMFDYAIKRHLCEYNPAGAFDLADAGGKEDARDRALSRSELVAFFEAMRSAKGFSVENELAVKLLLLLAVRKQELTAARWDEFDLDAAVWHLPAERTKTGAAISIPLPTVAVGWLRDLHRLACGSAYVFPARKMQHRMIPHIHENTLNVALSKVKHGLDPFTIHDLRRTARTHLAGLGVPPHVAEKVLNHKLKGVEGRYDRYDYFEERKGALNQWAALIGQLEQGGADVIPIHEKRAGGKG
ncbi:tyrosine-type recombinase/integrase [Aromatoleum bremense]|uniref:Tyrosine-type recombinase/integrase n=1 Tax=Aromatoleum bremense TaxID=76115 RepID=A0ABX1NWF1_9RHOO|nr:site-specific integrase [Aromatoleum bremense]NMG15860.1 tyrosine-type recombinase/integrase [Aromatoleum bremense]QTQ32067.1 Integrase, phage-related [Aromatoleum bremense]